MDANLRRLSQLPGLFTSSGQPEAVLHPSSGCRTNSTDLEKGVLSLRRWKQEILSRPGTLPISQEIDRPGRRATYTGGLGDGVQGTHPHISASGRGRHIHRPKTLAEVLGLTELQSIQDGLDDDQLPVRMKLEANGIGVEDDTPSNMGTPNLEALPLPSTPDDEDGTSLARSSFVAWGPGGSPYLPERGCDPLDRGGIDSIASDSRQGRSHDCNESPSRRSSSIPFTPTMQRHRGASQSHCGIRGGEQSQNPGLWRIAQAKFSKMRLPSSEMHVFGAHGGYTRSTSGMFLLSEQDLYQTLESVVQAFCLHHRNLPGQEDRQPSSSSQSTSPRPRLDSDSGAFVPGNKAGADSATTLNFPTTSYARFDPEGHTVQTIVRGSGDLSSTTTIVSRRSVAKISWEQDCSMLPRQPANDYPEHMTEARRLQKQLEEDAVFSNHFQGHQSPGLVRYGSPAVHIQESDSWKHNLSLTLFPPLESRHCTNEWINPPEALRQSAKYEDDIMDRKEPESDQFSKFPSHAIARQLSACLDESPHRDSDNLVKLDFGSIYQAMTGSRSIPRKRTHTCSEDCRPHVCADDTPLTGRSRSPIESFIR